MKTRSSNKNNDDEVMLEIDATYNPDPEEGKRASRRSVNKKAPSKRTTSTSKKRAKSAPTPKTSRCMTRKRSQSKKALMKRARSSIVNNTLHELYFGRVVIFWRLVIFNPEYNDEVKI